MKVDTPKGHRTIIGYPWHDGSMDKNVKAQETQPLKDRVNNRSRRINSPAFREFIGSGWGERKDPPPTPSPAKDYLPQRYQKLGADFRGERLVLSLIHISEPTRQVLVSRMPSSA